MIMKINFENKKELGELLRTHLCVDWEESEYLNEDYRFWEVDEDDFHDTMGNIEINPENILKYMDKNPSWLEVIYDDIQADAELRNWNVNAWRNS